ncbi:MAG: multicopper oxidase family protein [Alphaproteobacteria bacterium]|nr:multicopper oxidase family protein [Alphaproteobacteria bacterium]
MSLWWLLACAGSTPTGPAGDGDDGGRDSDPLVADTGAPDAWAPLGFVAPPDAVDIDPADDVVHVQLRAGGAVHRVEHAGGTLELAGYAYVDRNGAADDREVLAPGPTLRAKLGDTLRVELDNGLDAATTIHWHGLEVPWEMDGVPWKSTTIAPGESFTYEFVLTQAGTFWYHPHVDTERQVDLGLYGVVVVADPSEPAADQDLVVVLDDWTTGRTDDGWDETDASGAHGAHGGEGLWAVNGRVTPTLAAPAGSRLRLRVLDASNTGYLALQADADAGTPLRLLARDQGLLPTVQAPVQERLVPGDRVELEVDLGTAPWSLWDAPYEHHGGAGFGAAARVLTVQPDGDGAAPEPLPLSFPGGAVADDPGQTDALYVFSGDTGTGQWFINGEQFPDVTIESLDPGQDAVIEVRNLSPTAHPFHMHGHRFEVLSENGVPSSARRIEDTLDIGLYGTARLRFNADNEGEWMVHCHLLPHAEGGMMTVLRVGDPL